jgi:short subunit dehydrogenase-like uncharacterized protein
MAYGAETMGPRTGMADMGTVSAAHTLTVLERRFGARLSNYRWPGFLAGCTGLTREADELDLRQFAAWCRQQIDSRSSASGDSPALLTRGAGAPIRRLQWAAKSLRERWPSRVTRSLSGLIC